MTARKLVILRSPVLTRSGYGEHSRQLARYLLSRKDIDVNFIVLPWGNTPFVLDDRDHGGLIGEIMQRSVKPDTKCDATVSVQLPDEWKLDLAPVNVGITAGVETDRCNPRWIDACNSMSAVIVPSQHVKACLLNTGNINVPLHVVPEAYNDAIISGDPRPDPLEVSTSFNFLVFGQLTGNNPENDRKNLFYTIKWLCEAFKNDPDVGIVLKTNVGRNSRVDRNATKSLIAAVVDEARRGSRFPRVHLIHGDMTEGEVASLYLHPKIKALVTLTRGEGYGLPILEAAASGLPIIATSWSGHLDFLKHGKFVGVQYELVEIHKSRVDNDGRIFVPGARWANPIEEDAKKKLLKFRQGSSTPREWAEDLKKIILEKYSFTSVSNLYDEAFKGLI